MLKLEGATVRFGGLTAANQVDLHVKANEIFSVIGPNGAGKTTVFNAITGIYPPCEGRVCFLDREPKRALTVRVLLGFGLIGAISAALLVLGINAESLWYEAITARYQYREAFDWGGSSHAILNFLKNSDRANTLYPFCVGFLLCCFGAYSVWQRGRITPDIVTHSGIARTFQNIRLFKGMSVIENVLVGMERRLRASMLAAIFRTPSFKMEESLARKRALTILDLVGLKDLSERQADELSYGDQRRLEIARALASEPKLILLDEPAAGMNPAESNELMRLIRKIREHGFTVMLIEHHMNLVMEVSDRIAVLDYGNKIAEGTPHEVKANQKVIEAYLGKGE